MTSPLPLELLVVELSLTGAYSLAAFVLLRLVDLDQQTSSWSPPPAA